MKSFVLSILTVMALAAAVSATIIHVPGQRRTIQRGIDAASDGDTVLVQPGTYVENINFNGRNILLCSMFKPTGDTSYIAQTIIDGDSSGTVVTIESGEDSNAVLCGFTITNGLNSYGGGISIKNNSNPIITDNNIVENLAHYGGGIYCDSAGALIEGNNIESNLVGRDGAGIYFRNSNITIEYNRIFSNTDIPGGFCGGSGIYCVASNTVISNNIISNNYAYFSSAGGITCCGVGNILVKDNLIYENLGQRGGGILCNESNPVIEGNIIYNNLATANRIPHGGGGVYFLLSNATLINNTICNNSAEGEGGGIFVSSSSPTIINTIIYGDSSINGDEVYIFDPEYSSPSFLFCDIADTLWPGEGNISVFPFFRDPDNGDFHLMATYCGDPYDSPCIDMGDPHIIDSLLDCALGLGSARSDMGAYGGGDSTIVGIPGEIETIPTDILLHQNYPNPFNSSTEIIFSVPSPMAVKLDIFNLMGQKVATLIDGRRDAGQHSVNWNASSLSSGIYFYKLTAGDKVITRRMTLLK